LTLECNDQTVADRCTWITFHESRLADRGGIYLHLILSDVRKLILDINIDLQGGGIDQIGIIEDIIAADD
jgi:hypothetical protein